MHKVLLIEPNSRTGKELSSFLKQAKLNIYWAQDEEEIRAILICHGISLIIMEPLMSLNTLRDDTINIQNTEIGGVGLFLLNTIKKNHRNVKVLIHSVISKENLIKAGFSKTCTYMRKIESREKLIETINQLLN